MKTIAKVQPTLRRHIANVAFQRRQFFLLGRMQRMGISPQADLVMESLLNARTNAGLLSVIATNFEQLTQSGVVDQQLVESFPDRLRRAARIYTSGQHMFALGRVCVMGNAHVTAVGSMAHVKATGQATVILEGASVVASEGVCVFAHAGSKVRRFTTSTSL